jgi:hypothetical protein
MFQGKKYNFKILLGIHEVLLDIKKLHGLCFKDRSIILKTIWEYMKEE